MTVARSLLIGVGIAVVLLGVMAPAIRKVMIAILWGIAIFISAQLVLGRAIAFVLPSGPFPTRPGDEHASSDEAEVSGIGERPTTCRDATRHAVHAWEEVVSEPAHGGDTTQPLGGRATAHPFNGPLFDRLS